MFDDSVVSFAHPLFKDGLTFSLFDNMCVGFFVRKYGNG